MSPRVVRIPLQKSAPNDEDSLLVHAESAGPQKLDLRLVGTDNNGWWVTTTRDDRIVQNASRSVEPALWAAVLHWSLLGQAPEQAHMHITDRLDVLASIQADGRLVISFKQNISGIKKDLGTLSLEPGTEADTPDMFEWSKVQASEALSIAKNHIRLQDRIAAQDSENQELKLQMDKFLKEQKEREDLMLEQFRQLLNTKKLKIRDQQRLLAGAKVNPQAAQQVKDKRALSQKPTGRGPQRKRKGASTPNDAREESPKVKNESDVETDTEGMPTPQRSDDEDGDDSAFEAGLPTREQANSLRKSTQNAPKSPAPTTIPPRRELPFDDTNGRIASSPKEAAMKDAANGEEDDESDTDDEL